MSHSCQFYFCSSLAERKMIIRGENNFPVYVCLKHYDMLIETIQREFGTDKVMSDEGINEKEKYEYSTTK